MCILTTVRYSYTYEVKYPRDTVIAGGTGTSVSPIHQVQLRCTAKLIGNSPLLPSPGILIGMANPTHVL
jgi:hypothetical protein